MGLAYIGKILGISSIPEADRLESAVVVCGLGGRWSGVVQKGQFVVGDTVRVFLQDSVLPKTPEFSFMEKYGYRVRMARFRGAPSECIIMPMRPGSFGTIGADIAEYEGVTKYEKPAPTWLVTGEVYSSFPSFIPKTDEPNFQTSPALVQELRGRECYSTLKIDGSSATVYRKDTHFGCCSRNLELKPSESNAIWKIAGEFELEYKLLQLPDMALQFEVAGPGIQKNPLGLNKVMPFLFNVYLIEERRYLNGPGLWQLAKELAFPIAPVLDEKFVFAFETDEEIRQYADRKYPNGKPAEGVVVRPLVEGSYSPRAFEHVRLSIKVINLLYKEA